MRTSLLEHPHKILLILTLRLQAKLIAFKLTPTMKMLLHGSPIQGRQNNRWISSVGSLIFKQSTINAGVSPLQIIIFYMYVELGIYMSILLWMEKYLPLNSRMFYMSLNFAGTLSLTDVSHRTTCCHHPCPEYVQDDQQLWWGTHYHDRPEMWRAFAS